MATTPGVLRRPTRQHSLLSRAMALARARLDRRRLLALALAAAAALLTAQTVARSQAVQQQLGTTDAVVIAARDLLPGDQITEADVVVRQRPRGHHPPGSLHQLDDVVGAVVVAATFTGEPVALHRISTHRLGLRPDERAVTVPFPLAPPPLQVGDAVEVVGVGVDNGFDGLGDRGPVQVSARQLGSARVLVVDENGVTLAIGPTQVAPILEQLGGGTVELVFTPFEASFRASAADG